MAKLFKKFKIAKQKNIQKEKEKPKIKTLNVDQTHVGSKCEIQVICNLLDAPNRHKTAFRRIINLEMHLLNQNVYLIAKKVLQLALEENGFDNLDIIKVLQKLNTCDNPSSMHDLLYNYLIVSILGRYRYTLFLNFMLRHCSECIKRNKDVLLGLIEDPEEKIKVQKLKQIENRLDFKGGLVILNGKVEAFK